MKFTKKDILFEVYNVYKQLVLEQLDQTNTVDPYEKIKKLAELGEKIESQVQNSLTHLNGFMNLGIKTKDSFEFRRAVAEIARIQKLATDYQTIITKAHETAEATGGDEDIPHKDEAVPPKGSSLNRRVPSQKSLKQAGAEKIKETVPCPVCKGMKKNNGVMCNTCGGTGEADTAELKGQDPHIYEYGFILQSKYSDKSVMMKDVRAKNLKEAITLITKKYPTYEVKHVVGKQIEQQIKEAK